MLPALTLRHAAALCLLLVLSPPAPAQGSARAYLDGFDRNRDGRIALDEYQAYLVRGFDALDANRDGRLDPAEQPAGARRTALTRSQHRRRVAAAFRRQDRNRDGYLDVRELTAPPG